MKIVTLIIMLSNWQGGSAINTSVAFFTMDDCLAAAKRINASAPAGASAAVSALCVEARG